MEGPMTSCCADVDFHHRPGEKPMQAASAFCISNATTVSQPKMAYSAKAFAGASPMFCKAMRQCPPRRCVESRYWVHNGSGEKRLIKWRRRSRNALVKEIGHMQNR